MSKAFVRLATERDIDAICSLLHTKMNSRIPEARWRQLMTYQWLADKPDFGRVVESEGRVLGFCGMVYADRLIGDNAHDRVEERIVSMSSWYLDKSLRGQGLGKKMLVSSLADPNLTYATLTNSRKPLGIVESVGFKVLEDHRYVWKKSDGQAPVRPELVILDDFDAIRIRVEAHQRKIMDDMRGFSLKPILLESGDAQSLLFLSIKSKGEDVLWFDVMYVSNPQVFVDGVQSLIHRLLPDTPAVLAVDGRFLEKPPADALREQLPVGRYYFGERVARKNIDNLYSELQLLDLKLD